MWRQWCGVTNACRTHDQRTGRRGDGRRASEVGGSSMPREKNLSDCIRLVMQCSRVCHARKQTRGNAESRCPRRWVFATIRCNSFLLQAASIKGLELIFAESRPIRCRNGAPTRENRTHRRLPRRAAAARRAASARAFRRQRCAMRRRVAIQTPCAVASEQQTNAPAPRG